MFPARLITEAIIVAIGGLVVGDDGQIVDEEHAKVVDTAAHAEAVRPLAIAQAAVGFVGTPDAAEPQLVVKPVAP